MPCDGSIGRCHHQLLLYPAGHPAALPPPGKWVRSRGLGYHLMKLGQESLPMSPCHHIASYCSDRAATSTRSEHLRPSHDAEAPGTANTNGEQVTSRFHACSSVSVLITRLTATTCSGCTQTPGDARETFDPSLVYRGLGHEQSPAYRAFKSRIYEQDGTFACGGERGRAYHFPIGQPVGLKSLERPCFAHPSASIRCALLNLCVLAGCRVLDSGMAVLTIPLSRVNDDYCDCEGKRGLARPSKAAPWF